MILRTDVEGSETLFCTQFGSLCKSCCTEISVLLSVVTKSAPVTVRRLKVGGSKGELAKMLTFCKAQYRQV